MRAALDRLNEAEKSFAAAQGMSSAVLDELHALRRSRTQQPATIWLQLAEWVVAPVLAGFAEWMAGQAPLHHRPLFLGVMREGRLLARLMRDLFGVPAQEIWLNRNLAMMAAFGCGDDEALLNWMVRARIQPLTKAEAMWQLLGEQSDMPDSYTVLDVETARQLIENWQKSGALAGVKIRAAALADRLARHWQKTCGNAEADNIVLMDFASAGNIQRSLQKILYAKALPLSITGLNFAMTSGSRWAEEQGCGMRGYLSERGQPEWFAAACARTPELMEIFTAAPLGSLRDYCEDGEPVCGESFLTKAQQELAHNLQQYILAAAAFYHRHLGKNLTSEVGRCLWGRLLLQPLTDEAEALADWPLDAGLDGTAQRVLAARLLATPEPWSKIQTAWPAASRVLK